eukprot:7550662-Ditylum_brightwellii.AAC.1
MSILSNTLSLLPTNIQEMLVNQLITTIINTDAIKSQINAVSTCNMVNGDTPKSHKCKIHLYVHPWDIQLQCHWLLSLLLPPPISTVAIATTVPAAAASTTTSN